MKTSENLVDLQSELKKNALFLSQYASLLMGAGVHTSRVIRNTKRIGKALNVDIKVSCFHQSLSIAAVDKQTQEYFMTLAEVPHIPVNFELNTHLSHLSWEACDEHLSLQQIKRRYAHWIAKPNLPAWGILILTACANASFCALFGGDWLSRGIVFFATLVGMFTKQKMQKYKINQFLIFIFSAFLASMIASISTQFQTTSEIAIGTSVLYLIPGVPLINGFVDIMEGHVLNGSARLINAFLLIACIATGLSITLLLNGNTL